MNSLSRKVLCTITAVLVAFIIVCINCYADTISYDASADGEGNRVTVTLESDDSGEYGVTVSGSGAMKDYGEWDAPDELLGKTISSVTVEEGVTYIGDNFMNTFSVDSGSMSSVKLPDSLIEIGSGSFKGCSNVNSIVIPSNVQKIGEEAFWLDVLENDRTITINGIDVDFDETAFGFMMPPFEEYRLIFNIYVGGQTEENVLPYAEEDPFGNPYPATINKMDAFKYDENDSTKVIAFLASFTTVIMPDSARIISSTAFQNDNGKSIVSLDLNKVEKVEADALKGITSLKTIYAYNTALGQNGALEEGAFAGLDDDVTVYYKGDSVKSAFQEFGITNFVELQPFKTTAAKDISKTVETGTEEEIDLNGMFDALYDTTLTETYILKKGDLVIESGDCASHKYLFKAETAGEYELLFKAKDSDNVESEDVYTIAYTVLDNKTPYIKSSSKHSKVRALVKNQYSFDLQPIFMDDDEGDQLTYYYTRDLSKNGMQTSSTFRSTIDSFSPTKVSERRASYLQFLAKEEQIYFYAVDRFGRKSDFYTLTVVPHSCSLEITADDPADLKGVTKMMIKTADDTEVEPVETVNGVAYYDLDDLESYKYVVKKKGFQTVEQEFIQNQNAENINWKGMAYTVALEKDTNYDSAAAVDAKIDAIGEVALSDESKAAIKDARDAYDALDDAAKELVEGYDKLVIAEKTLAVLQGQADLEQANQDKQDAIDAKTKAETDLAAAKTALEQANTDKQAALDAKTKAETDLAAANAALEQANTDKQAALDAKAKAETDLAAANTALEKANTDRQAALDAKTKAEADLVAANTALEQANKDKQDAIDAKEKAEADLEKANQKNQSASDEVAALKEKIAAMELTVKGLKVKSKGRKFTIRWKKNAKAEGYKVQYKLENGKKFKTLKTVKKAKVISKKLKKGKKYQFRVATYKTVGGKKVYGKWTDVKTVKCK